MLNRLLLITGVIIMLVAYSCSTTKYVPANSHLLNKIEIDNSGTDLSKEELKYYVRQKGNVKILGFWRFHLGLYNLSGRDATRGFNKWLRRIGEEPVLYDELLKEKSNDQLRILLNNKGYFNAQVTDTVLFTTNKKAKVRYIINPGERYSLNSISYRIEDDSIKQLVYADTINSLLKDGVPFDAELHDKERDRLTRKMRKEGYFGFRKEYIYFLADSALGNNKVNDSLIIVKDRIQITRKIDSVINHRKYKIKDVFFLVGFDPRKALDNEADYMEQFDTLKYADCNILYGDNLNFRADMLINSNYIFPGQVYNQDLVEKTHALLSDIQLFRFVNIRFRPLEGESDEDGYGLLQCFIQLSPSKIQSYTFEIDGTNSSGNLGAAGSVRYKHKNFLRGGEVFDLRLRTARENQVTGVNKFHTLEVGGDATLSIPKFMIPVKIESFRKKYNPRTHFSLAYNYQRRPDYTRTIANGRIGYNWKSSKLISHFFAPIDFSVVNVPVIDSKFADRIENTFLKYSYQDHLINGSSYNFIYNEQAIPGNNNYRFFQFNVESAGNLIDVFANMFGRNEGDYYKIFGIRYAQYVKSDIDWRYHINVNKINSFVYRIFAGVGYPYGNLTVLPFDKRYFSGGANSIRAWPVRGLGPGSYEETQTEFYNQTADIKLEANAEYRFKLFWVLEGALFIDVGNIWTIRSSGDDQIDNLGIFKVDNFYKQVAVGVGAGTRLDFNYFVFRLDMGIKARDPSLEAGSRWVLGVKPVKWDDMAFNFAIGYPF